jgi:GNAT superfamily N-acetyltransferase
MDVRRLDATCEHDFWALHSAANDCGSCACVAWWVPTWDGWGERTAEENRALRRELFRRGEYDGYLAYAGDTPIGWCQVGPRDRLAKLVAQFRLAADPGCWAITCFLVAPGHRRRGAARELLALVLADLRRLGVARVEAYPRAGNLEDPLDLWTGPRSLYVEQGFTVIREDARRTVMQLEFESR